MLISHVVMRDLHRLLRLKLTMSNAGSFNVLTPERVHEKYKIDDAVGVKDGEASYVFTVDIRDSKNAGFEGTKPIDMAVFSRAVKSTFVGMLSAASQSAALDAVQVRESSRHAFIRLVSWRRFSRGECMIFGEGRIFFGPVLLLGNVATDAR